MKKIIVIGNLKCIISRYKENRKICYILYPMDWLESWIEDAVLKYKTSIAVVGGMDWDNDLTPWSAPGQPPGSPDFKGLAPQFLKTLINEVQPTVEKTLGIEGMPERNLVGVSLSGLFALWQWMICDNYRSIGCLSGSFWYDGFIQWFERQTIPVKSGEAFFLLGKEEPKSPVKAFDSVGENTEKIVKTLKSKCITTTFEWVSGNHFSDPIGRLNRTMAALFQ